ncbi:MAG: tRNA adenosine(34) deaminase TadA [Clostridia bacterium]|nr:tRNA adenosine(34) deaminase TadA [Clostridia bacterium]MBR6641670.1 tRNA adenosine(34) deaminase TadA [Clostridia bacterium]
MYKEKYMKEALKEAKKALAKDEVPIGAVIVLDDKIIARGHNLRETKMNSLKHAEIVVIDKACKKLSNFRLEKCELYVTLEPCLMCSGAIVQSRIKKVYFGANDEKYGAVTSVANAFEIKSNHKVEFESGILKEECEKIIKDFFKELREKKKNK